MPGTPPTRRRVVLSTCGTSLLTNGADDDTRQFLRDTANVKKPDNAQSRRLEVIAGGQSGRLSSASLQEAARMSAELNGIIRFYDGDLSKGLDDTHILIHTDTWHGKKTADAVAHWLERNQLKVILRPEFRDLRASDVDEFRAALPTVVKWCEDTLPGYSRAGHEIIFNLTGGFKSINGFFQVLGMFYADEIVYVFDASDALLRIPRLPVQRDFSDIVSTHFDVLRRLASRHAVAERDCVGLPEALLIIVDGQAALSEWGELVWERGRRALYEGGLLDPLPPLHIQKRFRADAAALLPKEPERMRQLNQCLDELAAAAAGGDNLRSLRFHKLKGDPRPPSTHECYVWTGDARRIYGHWNDDKFILDALGDHL